MTSVVLASTAMILTASLFSGWQGLLALTFAFVGTFYLAATR